MAEKKRRNRAKQTRSLEERLAADSERVRVKAAKLPAGRERDVLLKRIEQNDAATAMSAWLRSPALTA
jgi:hypothetical protein